MKLTQAYVKQLFNYRDSDGALLWKTKKARCISIGDIAGGVISEDGRKRVGINGKYYYTSRIIWLWFNGSLPKYIDHRDADPSNDRISNLRLASFSQNQMNRGPNHNHSLGIKNVYRYKDRFLVRIMANKKSHAKYFATLKEAKIYASIIRTKMHGTFARSA